jgi:hypothetical protein
MHNKSWRTSETQSIADSIITATTTTTKKKDRRSSK